MSSSFPALPEGRFTSHRAGASSPAAAVGVAGTGVAADGVAVVVAVGVSDFDLVGVGGIVGTTPALPGFKWTPTIGPWTTGPIGPRGGVITGVTTHRIATTATASAPRRKVNARPAMELPGAAGDWSR